MGPHLRVLGAIGLSASMAVACGQAVTPAQSPATTTPVVTSPGTKATPGVTAPTPEATPVAAKFDGVPATTLSLGKDAAPIDVIFAFGSIWTADHHQRRVTRIDPATMAVQARITVGAGPGWFVATDDALWVSSQLGRGLNRIDPITNMSDVHAGDWPTCGRGALAFGAIWQPACDAHQLMRIDLATNRSTDLSWGQRQSVVLVGDQFIAGGPEGLSRLDADTEAWTEIGGPAGWIMGFDGTSIWQFDDAHVLRVNPANGKTVASLDARGETNVAFEDGHALMTSPSGIAEVDLATSKVLRTIKLGFQPFGVLEAAGYVWLTNFDGSSLIRLEPLT